MIRAGPAAGGGGGKDPPQGGRTPQGGAYHHLDWLVFVATTRRASARRAGIGVRRTYVKTDASSEFSGQSGFPYHEQNQLQRLHDCFSLESSPTHVLRSTCTSMTGLGGVGSAAAAIAWRGIGKRSLVRRRRPNHQPQLLLGPEFVATISPMKRILCLCPVLSNPEEADATLVGEGYQLWRIGMAVSDPYLAYATPIEIDDDGKTSEEQAHGLYVYKGIGAVNKAAHPTYWKGMAPTRQEFLQQVGYQDIGGIAFARPLRMRHTRTTQLDAEKFDDARRSLQTIVGNFTNRIDPSLVEGALEPRGGDGLHLQTRVRPSEFNLQCFIDRGLTYEEALEMAECEPEMWEATFDLEVDVSEEKILIQDVSPSVQAAAVLNSFLWDTTGGWRNTFA